MKKGIGNMSYKNVQMETCKPIPLSSFLHLLKGLIYWKELASRPNCKVAFWPFMCFFFNRQQIIAFIHQR